MNNTNRALNRLGIALLGVVLLVLGAGVAVAAAVPSLFSGWADASGTTRRWIGEQLAATRISGTPHSWILVGVGVLALVVLVLLVAFALRQGKGRSRELVREDSSDGGTARGTAVVQSAVAEQIIGAALADDPRIVASSVSTYRVQGVNVLKVSVSARRGASPRDIRSTIDAVVAHWDALLGRELPVLITINSGWATRFAKETRTASVDASGVSATPVSPAAAVVSSTPTAP
ncbi:hypothetical protein [Glaciihabitans sp. dw_435]|uniref:hypothetical protein n=1 Tax=Glaciihabitans sp. dw_435 TaxID=2720081 RepID=UPI001BD5690E|nr:hypothetical protein [Glaciihabitans sp. dw_435]